MYLRAHRAEAIEKELRAARTRLDNLNNAYDMLSKGEWPDVPHVTDNMEG